MGFENRDYHRDGGPPGGFRNVGGLAIPTPGWGSVTAWLLILNAGVFLFDAILARVTGTAALFAFGYFSFDTAVGGFQAWRFLTFQFLHGGLGHLLGNCLGLFFFGPMVESYLGSRRFLAFYLVSGVFGAIAYLVLLMLGVVVAGPQTQLVGASGGVFAILAAAATIAPNSRVLLFFLIPIPLKVLIWGLLFIAAFVVLGEGDNPASNAGGQAAHLGGALMGFVFIRKPGLLNWADGLGEASLRERVHHQRATRRLQAQARHEATVDAILDKVHREGLQSLTKREKAILQRDTEQKKNAG